jgi:hypothetical protein
VEATVKDIYQVLREKEQALARVRQEVEALRFCAPMLTEANEATPVAITAPGNLAPTNRWPADVEASPSSSPYHN